MSQRFNNINRKRWYLNESTTALRIIQILTHSHLVLQTGTGHKLANRSLPNTFARSIASLLLNYLQSHSNIPHAKLGHQYREILAVILASNTTPLTTTAPVIHVKEDDKDKSVITPQEAVEESKPTTPPPSAQIEPQPSQPSIKLNQPETTTPQQPIMINKPAPTTTAAPNSAAKFSCQTCVINFPTIALYRTHLRSPEHQQRLRTRPAGGIQTTTTTTNPESQSLPQHTPSAVSFSPQADDDDGDHDGEKRGHKNKKSGERGDGKVEVKSSYSCEKIQFGSNSSHPNSPTTTTTPNKNGILDFKYTSIDDDDDDHFLPSASTRKGQRRLSESEGDLSDAGSAKGGSDGKKSKKGKKSSSAKSTPNQSDMDSDDSAFSSDYSEYEDDGSTNDGAGSISNKAGTEVVFVSYPTNPQPQDPKSTTPNPHQPYHITTTRNHHPQNIVLVSPQLGLLLIPAAAAQLSNLTMSKDDEDDVETGVVNATAALTKADKKQNKSAMKPSYNPIIQASFMYFFRLIAQTMPYKATNVIPPMSAIIMDSGGKFALTMFLGNVIIYHTSFANYTTRKKQGKSQSAHDRAGGHASSAGSTIRRQQTDRHKERIKEIMYHLRGELSLCQQILMYIPSIYMREQLFLSKEQQIAWAQSGGTWIGQSSLGLDEPSAVQRAIEIDNETNQRKNNQLNSQYDQYGSEYDQSDYLDLVPAEFRQQFSQPRSVDDDDSDDDNDPITPTSPTTPQQPQKSSNFSPNHALLTTHRDMYVGTAHEPYPVSSVPLTTALAIPNLIYNFNTKYSTALTQLSTTHRSTIDKTSGEYQMLYFQRLNKKNAKKGLQLLTKKALEDDDDDEDIAHRDHSITAEWHRDTLMYHYNHSDSISPNGSDGLASPNDDDNTNSFATQPINPQSNKRVIYVDQYLPNSPMSGFNLNPQSFQSDPTGTQPPKFTGPIQLPATAQQSILMKKSFHQETDQQQYPASSYRLSSFLDPSAIASVKPSLYTIQPYHPHTAKSNYTPQHEHLWLLHPNDPRIAPLGLTVHDAKHNEIVRVYQHLMMCTIKPLEIATDGEGN